MTTSAATAALPIESLPNQSNDVALPQSTSPNTIQIDMTRSSNDLTAALDSRITALRRLITCLEGMRGLTMVVDPVAAYEIPEQFAALPAPAAQSNGHLPQPAAVKVARARHSAAVRANVGQSTFTTRAVEFLNAHGPSTAAEIGRSCGAVGNSATSRMQSLRNQGLAKQDTKSKLWSIAAKGKQTTVSAAV